MARKSFFRTVRRLFGYIGLLLAGGLLFLWVRPLFADTLELSGYNHASEADVYHCLPLDGSNFAANSRIGHGAGRYYLKGRIAACALAAYADLAQNHPEYRYIYGEMGWKGGGRFRPHRTHQQGMNADFMTPVYTLGENGEKIPAVLPCNAANLWGYNIRVDEEGRYEEYRLDTGAMIAHLAALKKHAPRYGVKVERVIFDPPLLKLLRADPDFKMLGNMVFMEKKAWFPHDGHYHVDFAR